MRTNLVVLMPDSLLMGKLVNSLSREYIFKNRFYFLNLSFFIVK